MTTPPRSWMADALFALALLAYPRAFRRRFGKEMREAFRGGDAVALLSLVVDGLAERGAAVVRWAWFPSTTPHLYEPSGRSAMFWDTIRADVRFTLRQAWQAPLYTALAVAALALGIGANSAIFTVVQGILLRPLPYSDPGRLVMAWSHNTKEDQPETPMSPADFLDLREGIGGVARLEGYYSFVNNASLVLAGSPEIVVSSVVSPGLFDLLGRRARVGRTLQPGDGAGTLVLSHGFWQRRFGGDPSIVGRTVAFDGSPGTVIGVMPPDFVFPYRGMLALTGFVRTTTVDVWTPMLFEGARMVDAAGRFVRNVHYLAAVGRLTPGVTVERARAGMAVVASRLERAYPETNAGWTTTVTPLHEQVVGRARPALFVLLAGVGVILLMACVNVAGLILARSVSRQNELALRAALGASRWRLVRQALTENLILAGAGGVAGLLLAYWGVRGLVGLAPANLPRLQDVTMDWSVVLVTLGLSAVAGLLVGIVPALVAGSANVRAALQDGRGTTAPQSRHRTRNALVVVELALAVVLTIGAGLLLRSFQAVMTLDPGFRPDHLLTMQMTLPSRVDTPDARRAYYAEWFERLAALPGVTAVGGTTRIPLGSTNVTTSVQVESRPLPVAERPEVEFRRAMHDYFGVMGIPIVRGRGFTPEDGPNALPVVIVNETMARKVFGTAEPVGQRVRMGPDPSGPWSTVVGVIGDIRHGGLEEAPMPEIYINYLANPPVAPFIALRTTGDPVTLVDAVRTEARRFDSALALFDMRTMEEIRSASVAERRFVLWLMSAFGVLALGLAAVGVYGVLVVVVSERTQEMGVRLALGAAPAAVLAMVVRQALALTACGVAAGVVIAAALTPLMADQLFGVPSTDPLTYLAVPLLLMAVAGFAAVVPGRRAMRIDPVRAMNS